MNQDKNNKNNNIVEFVADHDKPFHQHLLLNYCFGYKDSTLLLCPYRLLTSHINHDLTNNPNARVVWAHDEQMLHPEWKKKSTEEWGTTEAVGLGFNFVALRDIDVGEELTIDYSRDWDQAWDKHVQLFSDNDNNNNSKNNINGHCDREKYIPAYELNKSINTTSKTTDEEDYYENQGLYVFCRKPYLEWSSMTMTENDDNNDNYDGNNAEKKLPMGWQSVVDVSPKRLYFYHDDGQVTWNRPREEKNGVKTELMDYYDWDEQQVFPCRIRQRYTTANDDTSTYYYSAEVFERRSEETVVYSGQVDEEGQRQRKVLNSITTNRLTGVLFDIPRDAFYFEDRNYYRPHYQIWSFRHDMRIPDKIMPNIWRNNIHR